MFLKQSVQCFSAMFVVMASSQAFGLGTAFGYQEQRKQGSSKPEAREKRTASQEERLGELEAQVRSKQSIAVDRYGSGSIEWLNRSPYGCGR